MINIECACTDYAVERNIIRDCPTSWTIRIGWDSFASTDDWSGIIRGNRIENVTHQTSGSLAGYAGGIIAYGRDTVICDNYIDTVTSTTGNSYGIYTKLRRGKVYANTVQNITTTTGSDICGVNLKGGERGGVDVYGYDTLCWGNTVLNVGSPGVSGVGIRAQSEEQNVFGNIIENFGLIGINIDESGTSKNSVLNNTIIGTGATSETGIYITGGNQHACRANRFKDCSVAVRVGSSTAQDSIVISDNLLECPASGSNYGVSITGTASLTNLSVERNRFVGTWTQAIRHDNTSATVTGWRIVGNIAANATTKIFCATTTTPASAMPTDAIVQDNEGYLSGSKTQDWPSLASGAQQSTTLTVTGALIGDKVDVSMSIGLSGTRLTGEVTAANTVTVYQSNMTAAAVDLASGTLYATCRRVS